NPSHHPRPSHSLHQSPPAIQPPHSFPTRRSSDLEIFNGQGKCSTCHIPPLYTEPGNNVHAPSEIGVDSFQADRPPTHMYRTSPLDRKSTRLNSSHVAISYAVFCLKKKTNVTHDVL